MLCWDSAADLCTTKARRGWFHWVGVNPDQNGGYHSGTGLDIFPPAFPNRIGSEVDFMEWISNPEAWVALATLTVLEIVLGIDNVVFIAIVAGRLPEEEQGRAW